jgi:hypothetical protein
MSTNYSATTPAAPAGKSNVVFQSDGKGNISAYYTPSSGGVTEIETAGIATGGPITTTGTITVEGSGSTEVAATAATNVASAPAGDVITADGSGNVEDSGTLLSSLAPKASPALTGVPTAPTAAAATNTTQIATTAFVESEIPLRSAVTSVFTRTGAVTAQSGDYTVSEVTGAAPLASPALTGVPTAPTAAAATNTTQIATTAFVESEIPLRSAVTSVFGRTGAVVASTGDYTQSQISAGAIANGTTATTQAALSNDTKVATDAYVDAGVAVETSRAETAEALLAPKASPTFTGTATFGAVDLTTPVASAVANSPVLQLAGVYETTGSAYAADEWQIQGQPGSGVGTGGSNLQITHVASEGSGISSVTIEGVTPVFNLQNTTGTTTPTAQVRLITSNSTIYWGYGSHEYAASGTFEVFGGSGTVSNAVQVFTTAGQCGIGIGNLTPSATLEVYNAKASTGSTQLLVQGGAAAADATTNALFQVNKGGGTTSVFEVLGSGAMILGAATAAPTSAGTAGTAGEVVYYGGNLYLCSVSGSAGSATWNKISMTAV